MLFSSRRKTRSGILPCTNTSTTDDAARERTERDRQQITTPAMVSQTSKNKRAADDLSLGESSDDDLVGNLLKRPCVRNEGKDGEKKNVDVETIITI